MLLFEGERAVEKVWQVTGSATLRWGSGESVRDTYGDYVLNEDGSVRHFEPAVLTSPTKTRASASLRLWREYAEADGGLVENAVDVLREGKVEVLGVPDSKLVSVELYDDLAPKTLDFFRHAIDLQFKPVGALPIMMTYENTYIFKAEKAAEKYKEILPENVPQGKVAAGELGVTNQAAKRHGMVGVKLEDDDLFGPTGEKFTSTNIIGRILEPEKLKGMKDGDIMYVIEDAGSDQ